MWDYCQFFEFYGFIFDFLKPISSSSVVARRFAVRWPKAKDLKPVINGYAMIIEAKYPEKIVLKFIEKAGN
jgi:hypothetical protein